MCTSFLSPSKLECGLQEFNSRKYHFHLTFKSRRRFKKCEFVLIMTFSLPSPSPLLKLPIVALTKENVS